MNCMLVRHGYLSSVTLGHLYVGSLALATLEEPWIKNSMGPGGQPRSGLKHESCVPDGNYVLEPHSTVKHPHTWALTNAALGVWHNAVPPSVGYGRAAILIHTGNTTADIEGCILVGLRHGRIDGIDAVLESRAAFAQLQARLGTSTHSLEIRPVAGTTEVSHV